MKYLVTEIQTFADGNITNPTYAFDDRLSAEAKYHSILAAAAKSALPTHACMMFTSTGSFITSQVYSHAVEQEETPTE